MIIYKNLHYNLHMMYGYIIFLLHIPFHILHERDYPYFTLRGSILCNDCDYSYDIGYYQMKCERCYNNSKWVRI